MMNSKRKREIKEYFENEYLRSPDIPELTVILPTYNRANDLMRTLSALEKQGVKEDLFEIIVVDDGSYDSTASVLREFAKVSTTRFSYAILKENGGPARARNFGLAMSRGKIILIIGDDIEPAPSLLEKHLSFHRNHPSQNFALLGYVTFPIKLPPNAFMRWLETDGRKYFFNYAELVPNQKADPIFFYTCNVSVKASLLEKSGWFNESFPYASHEDLELGYRLADQGMQLIYDPSARGFHWHKLSVRGIARRVYLMGFSAVLFWTQVKDRGSLSKRLMRLILAQITALPLIVALWHRLLRKQYRFDKQYPFHWHTLLFISFFVGLHDSMKKQIPRL